MILVIQTGRDFSYLRQTTRTNNAAMVAAGGLKPTSVYSVERIQDRLRVIAHLSEPIDKFWLEDNAALATFVSDELLYGLLQGLVGQVLNGKGTGESMTGLNSTSGIQMQALVTTQPDPDRPHGAEQGGAPRLLRPRVRVPPERLAGDRDPADHLG